MVDAQCTFGKSRRAVQSKTRVNGKGESACKSSCATCTVLGIVMKKKHTSAHTPVLEAWKNNFRATEGLMSSDNCGIAGTSGTYWKGGN